MTHAENAMQALERVRAAGGACGYLNPVVALLNNTRYGWLAHVRRHIRHAWENVR